MPSLTEVFNWLIVMMGTTAVWYQWRAYRILKSPAFVILTVALIYLTIYRAVLPYYSGISGYGADLPFYLLMVVHGVLMTRALTGVLDAAELEQPDVRKEANDVDS